MNCDATSGPSARDNFTTASDAFSMVSLALTAFAAIVGRTYASYCPSKARIDEMQAILTEFRAWMSRLSEVDRLRFEAHHPGALAQWAKDITIHQQNLDNLTLDLRASGYRETYNPLSNLGQRFDRAEKVVNEMNSEFRSSTEKFRLAQMSAYDSRFQGAPPGGSVASTSQAGSQIPLAGATMLANVNTRRVTILLTTPIHHIRNINLRNAVQGANNAITDMVQLAQSGLAGVRF
ncbi:hypothetical protein BV20DRAFT_983557 [Pilatotrama ljubarskyi]|nr:hypothetical protein BV20DRAFT_983557 [Pilatotrama ljubarskyi]